MKWDQALQLILSLFLVFVGLFFLIWMIATILEEPWALIFGECKPGIGCEVNR